MTTQTRLEQLEELAEMIVTKWADDFDNDEEISGCDAVDSLACYVELAQCALLNERT